MLLREPVVKIILLLLQNTKVGAVATCLVTNAGIVTSVDITDGGGGYTAAPTVTFGQVGIGSTALGSAFINAVGVVTGVQVSYSGTGYTQDSPPTCLIAPPSVVHESNEVGSYQGDSGIIVGFGTVGSAAAIEKSLIFDIHIPYDSYLRNTDIVGTAVTLSGIQTGDYFMVKNTYVGFADTTVKSLNIADEVIGIGTLFVDNIYQVDTVTNHITGALTGIGTTTFRRVTAKIAGVSTITWDFSSAGQGKGIGWSGAFTTSYYIGDLSWGKINLVSRDESNTFNAYTRDGVAGIVTSGLVTRTKPLKAKNYDGQIV